MSLATSRQNGHRASAAVGPPTSAPLAPSALRNSTFIEIEQADVGITPLDGRPHQAFSHRPAEFERPVRLNGGVAYMHDGSAYFLAAPFQMRPRRFASADRLIPGLSSDVGLEHDTAGQPSSLEFVSPVSPSGGRGPFQLPIGYVAVAEVPDGILLYRPGDHDLTVWTPSTARFVIDVGHVRRIIDTNSMVVAWQAADGCTNDAECPLHITDMGSGKDRVVAPLPGHRGFVGGGAFSPDGRLLAAFVSARPDIGRSGAFANVPEAQLVVIDDQGSVATPGNAAVPVGEPAGAAVWSTDHVFFGGTAGVIHAYAPGDTQAITLNIPSSYSFTIYRSR